MFLDATDPQLTNEDYQSNEQATGDTDAQDRKQSPKNQGNTDDILNLDSADEVNVRVAGTETAATILATPGEQPNTTELLETYSPRARNLGKLIENIHIFDKGYDSDGQIGPFYGAISKEVDQVFDEEELEPLQSENTERTATSTVTATDAEAATGAADNESDNTDNNQHINKEALINQTVAWLKSELVLRL